MSDRRRAIGASVGWAFGRDGRVLGLRTRVLLSEPRGSRILARSGTSPEVRRWIFCRRGHVMLLTESWAWSNLPQRGTINAFKRRWNGADRGFFSGGRSARV